MIKGTHNTMSYLPVRQWWLRPFRRFGRCQDKTLEEQWEAGVRYYDLRIRFDGSGRAVFAHGLIEYRSAMTPAKVIVWLMNMAWKAKEAVYIRVLLECTRESQTENMLEQFIEFCRDHCCSDGLYIRFVVGAKVPFRIVYGNFNRPFIEVAEWINSPLKFLRTPRWYARGIQAVRVSALGADYEGIVSMDFV